MVGKHTCFLVAMESIYVLLFAPCVPGSIEDMKPSSIPGYTVSLRVPLT